MKSTSVHALFSLTLLLSVSSALANPVIYGQREIDTVPVVLLSPYESENVLKVPTQKAALSGGVGLVEGAIAQKLLGADKILEKAGQGDTVAVLQTIGLGLVLWKTGHMAREKLQDGAKNSDSWYQEMFCSLAGFAGFAAGIKLAK
jgi:hypothetical protein